MSSIDEEVVPKLGGYRNTIEEFALLKCTLCEKYLSVAPVRSSADGQINICGRCDQNDLLDNRVELFHNLLFELAARFVIFPSSSGCSSLKQWNTPTIHQKNCPNRRIDCIDPACPGFIKFCELAPHFEDDHVLFNGYAATMILRVGNTGVALIQIENLMFAFVYRIGSGQVWYNIYGLNYENRNSNFSFAITDRGIRTTKVMMHNSIIRWNRHRSILHVGDMKLMYVPSFIYASNTFYYTVNVNLGGMGIEGGPKCHQCSCNIREDNYILCPIGHTICLHCNAGFNYCLQCRLHRIKTPEETISNYVSSFNYSSSAIKGPTTTRNKNAIGGFGHSSQAICWK